MAKKSFMTGHNPSIGKTNFAGMPDEVMMEQYPEYSNMTTNELDDTLTGIDKVCKHAETKREKYISNQK